MVHAQPASRRIHAGTKLRGPPLGSEAQGVQTSPRWARGGARQHWRRRRFPLVNPSRTEQAERRRAREPARQGLATLPWCPHALSPGIPGANSIAPASDSRIGSYVPVALVSVLTQIPASQRSGSRIQRIPGRGKCARGACTALTLDGLLLPYLSAYARWLSTGLPRMCAVCTSASVWERYRRRTWRSACPISL